jgi:PIN domain nuclease of toxin-antitoxin system
LNILLDTHIFLWSISEPKRIPKSFLLELESLANVCFISSVSIAEIMIKASIGKLEVNFNPIEEAENAGFEMLDFSGKAALPLKDLPFHHRDPFDRMIIAQSITNQLPIMTCDPLFSKYECPRI